MLLFPYEQLVICAFHTFHVPRAFLTCLVFLTLVEWQRNGFWQNNTEVTDWFEKKHSVPVGGIRLFRSCFMTLHPHGPSPLQTVPPLPLLSLPDFSPSTFQQRLIQLKITPAESWVMLSVDPTFPILPPTQQCILLQPSFHFSFMDSCHSPDSLSSPPHRMPQCTSSTNDCSTCVL